MQYNPDDYNDHQVLKIPLLLGLVLVFAFKHLLLFLLPYLPTMGDSLAFLKSANATRPHLLLFLSSLPGVLVAAVGFTRRTPEAGPAPRWIWRRGRLLLSAAILAEFAFFGFQIQHSAREIDGPLLTLLYLGIISLVYLWTSPKPPRVFREFPPANRKAG